VLPLFLCVVVFVLANAVSLRASSRVFVGGLELRLFEGDDAPDSDDADVSNLPMKVQRLLFNAGVDADSTADLASLTELSVVSDMLREVRDEFRLWAVA
jgi:hypothetical protein